jgi:hypothetical protein
MNRPCPRKVAAQCGVALRVSESLPLIFGSSTVSVLCAKDTADPSIFFEDALRGTKIFTYIASVAA